MLNVRSWSPRRKVAAATALALLLLAPLGISQDTQPVVTGHATFYNGQGFDKCLASVAGILRTQVMWFNDQVLAERYGGKGTYIYVTENGSADPTDNNPTDPKGMTLYSDGTAYDFVDPNGVSWHVDEAFFGHLTPVQTGNNVANVGDYQVAKVDDPTYVWIVELSAFPIHDQFAGSPTDSNYHDVYNFLALVDTCKFHRNGYTHIGYKMNGQNYDYNITHDNNPNHDPNDPNPPDELTPAHGHPYGTGSHTHETFMADIWVGTQPTLVPVGADGTVKSAQWESDWAANPKNGAVDHTTNAPGTYANSTLPGGGP